MLYCNIIIIIMMSISTFNMIIFKTTSELKQVCFCLFVLGIIIMHIVIIKLVY